MKKGDRFDIGIIDGPRGKALIAYEDEKCVHLETEFEDETPSLLPLHLICSFTRPAAAGRILREMTSMGVSTMSFFVAKKSEKSYSTSRIWQKGEYRRFLVEGAEQAFCTRIPKVNICESLKDAIDIVALESGGKLRKVALDNYESSMALSQVKTIEKGVVFAIGPERGWSGGERMIFRDRGFSLCDLGTRVLRSDTAAIASASILISKLKIS